MSSELGMAGCSMEQQLGQTGGGNAAALQKAVSLGHTSCIWVNMEVCHLVRSLLSERSLLNWPGL